MISIQEHKIRPCMIPYRDRTDVLNYRDGIARRPEERGKNGIKERGKKELGNTQGRTS